MEVASLHPQKRILFVITKANWGGAQRYVFDLATATLGHGHEVLVVSGTEGELTRRLRKHGVAVASIQSMQRDVRFTAEIKAFLELFHTIRQYRPDIVHGNSSKAGLMAGFVARLCGVKRIVFTAHGWAFNEKRPAWQKAIIAIAHALTVYISHVTICASDAIRRDILFVPGIRKKLVVIRHGIQEPVFKSREAARAALAPTLTRSKWIGMLSELHPTKRVEDAITAFKDIVHEYPDTALVVMGEGEEREKLEAQIQALSLTNNVILAGFVSGGASYLRAFDLFLHASRTEALAYALIEAGYAKLPVVATNVGGIPEVVEDGVSGILVPPEQPIRIAEGLTSLIIDTQKAEKYGEALSERVHTRFSIERMVRDTERVYENQLKN